MKKLTCVALALCGAGLLFASPSGESAAEGSRELTIWEGLWANPKFQSLMFSKLIGII